MIIFFYGENDFQINKKLKELKDKFKKEVDPKAQNIFEFYGENIKNKEIFNEISNESLFSDKKMIIISDLIESQEKNICKDVLQYLKDKKIQESSHVFIFKEKNIKSKLNKYLLKKKKGKEIKLNKEEANLFDFLKKQKYSQEFEKYNKSELILFIEKEFNSYNINIDKKEAEILISLVGDNPWNVSTEIKKIANFKLFKKNESKIKKNDIEGLASVIFVENIFKFTDAISNKDKKQALKILEEQYLAESSPEYILSMLLRQFKILLQIRDLLDLNYNSQKIISSLKLHPFIINKGINQAKNFEKSILKKILNNLFEIEKSSKSDNTNIKVALNLLLIKI
jgi:DNA polymerase III subunit delta